MKNDNENKAVEKYLQEARTWETDKIHVLLKSRKAAWWVASGSGVIALAAVLAVAGLTPLKTTVPYVIRVNNTTGAVDVAQAMKDGKTNYDEVMNKFFVQWYVRYREGYSKAIAEDYYTYVGTISNGIEQQKYYAAFNPKNPKSPLNIYGSYARVRVDIQSTSFINPNVALVRYTKKVERGNEQPQISHWAATITFSYLGAPTKEKDRSINPLGFQVSEYRNDPDAAVNNINTSDYSGQDAAATPTATAFPSATSNTADAVLPSTQQ